MSVTWSTALIHSVVEAVADDPVWGSRLQEAIRGRRTIHLAILIEPFLRYILQGTKTIESRFARRPIDPYKNIRDGDLLLLKRSSGPVVGICSVTNARFFELNDEVRRTIRERFAKPLCATSPDFWEERRDKKYATLMDIEDVRELPKLTCAKRDRRGWVTLERDLFVEVSE